MISTELAIYRPTDPRGVARIHQVVRDLRVEGFLAWIETFNGGDVIATDATLSMVAMVAGHGCFFAPVILED